MSEETKTEMSVEQRALEELNVKIKGIGDSLGDIPATVKEEVDQRIKDISGDVKAYKEEMEEKLTKADERLTAAIQEQRAPAGVAIETREEDYGYGNELGGFDEMVAEVRAAGNGMGIPERLKKMHTGEVERRGLDTLTGAGGGYWMRPTFSDQLLQIPPAQQWLSSMVKTLPKTDPPNGTYTFNAFDQSGAKGVFGGVAVYSAQELVDLDETDYPSIMTVSLKPEKVGAFWTVSEESQANTPQMGSMMQPLINGAILAHRDSKIQTGTGVGEFKGFASSPAMIDIARDTADRFQYVDMVYMMARAMSNGGGRFVWICQKVTMLPELMFLTNGDGRLMWADNARDGIPAPTLGGIPVFFNEISPSMGTEGDMRLINLDYYLVKPGMGATLKSDMGILNFKKGEEMLKVSYYEDGKPWITSPLTLQDGTNTVSPFIQLTDVA